jgi:hypothetical protein
MIGVVSLQEKEETPQFPHTIEWKCTKNVHELRNESVATLISDLRTERHQWLFFKPPNLGHFNSAS